MLEPTGKVSVSLRRYCRSDVARHTCSISGYHNAKVFIEEELAERDGEGYIDNSKKPAPLHDDSRWPTQCACGYIFREEDEWQRFTEQIYRRIDTGEETTIAKAEPGAMWHAWWMDRFQIPQGKHNLVVKTPGGEWCIDSQASNCTMSDDRMQERHHCWVQHGEPPGITVDKSGVTCGAGAGSVQANNWHGFLRNGYLELKENKMEPENLQPAIEAEPIDPDIEKRFTYHPPKGSQLARYERLRAAAKSLAYLIKQSTPYSREQSLALTHLEDVVYCANAAIARNE
jgi:hypothetical protein